MSTAVAASPVRVVSPPVRVVSPPVRVVSPPVRVVSPVPVVRLELAASRAVCCSNVRGPIVG